MAVEGANQKKKSQSCPPQPPVLIRTTIIGIKKEDIDNLDKIMKEFNFFKFICIDVANGYSQFFVEFVERVRKAYPSHTIMVRNVLGFKYTTA